MLIRFVNRLLDVLARLSRQLYVLQLFLSPSLFAIVLLVFEVVFDGLSVEVLSSTSFHRPISLGKLSLCIESHGLLWFLDAVVILKVDLT